MRADRHYVDLIASRTPAAHDRIVPVSSLDAPAITDVPALVPLIDSVKRHGVLQPLIVVERDGQLRVVAGQRRLAAAIAAGLREVPCLVHDVDDEEAGQLRAATNIGANTVNQAPVAAPQHDDHHSGAEIARALGTASALADLLSGSVSDLSRGTLATLLRAELWRASTVVQASRVVRGELPLMRGAVAVAAMLDAVLQGFAAERRLRHVELIPQVDLPAGHIVIANEAMLAAALAGSIVATLALLDGAASGRIAVVAGLTATRQLTLVASQDHVRPSTTWAERAFDAGWRDRAGGPTVALAMAAVERAARAHGGEATACVSLKGSRIGLTIPAGA